MKFLILTAALLIPFIPAAAQYNPGARQIAMANADAALSDDLFALYCNPAGLARAQGISAAVFYSPSPFGMKELALSDAAAAWRFRGGALAAGFMQYGFSLYRESTFSIAYAGSPAKGLNSGISLNYKLLRIQNYGSAGALIINAGCQYFIFSNFSAGFCIYNISRSTAGGQSGQLPSSVDMGIGLTLTGGFSVCAAAEKELEMPASLKIGAEWQIIPNISVRYGLATQPERYTAGIGIDYGMIRLDYAVFTHSELGLTHQFDTVFRINY